MEATYRELVQQIRRCDACSFRHPGISPLAPADAVTPVAVMFIGENPSWADGQDVPFAGSTISGRALDAYYLQPLKLTRQQVWITDLFKCRYPIEIYRAKGKHEHEIQTAASTCVQMWLIREVQLARPRVIVTLSDRQVYQRLRRIFGWVTPAHFAEAVGRPHQVLLGDLAVMLFPMIHPDISRPPGVGDNRKSQARERWASIHQTQHIPALSRVLAS